MNYGSATDHIALHFAVALIMDANGTPYTLRSRFMANFYFY